MKKGDAIKAAKPVFEFQEKIDRLYVTSDETCFTAKNNANNHAKTLEDTSVVEVLRNGKSDETKPIKEGLKIEKKGEDGISAKELTEPQQVLRLVKDFTVDELKEIAIGFRFKAKDIQELKEEELAKKLVSESTEAGKQKLIEIIQSKKK